MLPRRLLPWLFALTLLFGQAAVLAHGFAHAHDPALPDHVCEVCVAQASLGSAAPATLFSLPVDPVRFAESLGGEARPADARARRALARAPPAAI